MRTLLAVVLTMCLATSTLADVVVLHSGDRIDGTVADREVLRERRVRSAVVAILPEDSMILRRFERADVDHVILSDGLSKDVIDMTDTAETALYRAYSDEVRRARMAGRQSGGTLFLATGLTVGLLGAIVKLGGETSETARNSVPNEKSYNAANYIMMGTGALLVVIGIARESDSFEARFHGVQVAPSTDDLAVSYSIHW